MSRIATIAATAVALMTTGVALGTADVSPTASLTNPVGVSMMLADGDTTSGSIGYTNALDLR